MTIGLFNGPPIHRIVDLTKTETHYRWFCDRNPRLDFMLAMEYRRGKNIEVLVGIHDPEASYPHYVEKAHYFNKRGKLKVTSDRWIQWMRQPYKGALLWKWTTFPSSERENMDVMCGLSSHSWVLPELLCNSAIFCRKKRHGECTCNDSD